MLGPVGKFARRRPVITAGLAATAAWMFGAELIAAGLIGGAIAVVTGFGRHRHEEAPAAPAAVK
jgi:hypothetical protein